MEHLVSFGEWLRQRRLVLDLTRAELGQRAGYFVSALSKIEADQRRPSRQLAELLAPCVQIPPEERPAFVNVVRGVDPVRGRGAAGPRASGCLGTGP